MVYETEQYFTTWNVEFEDIQIQIDSIGLYVQSDEEQYMEFETQYLTATADAEVPSFHDWMKFLSKNTKSYNL